MDSTNTYTNEKISLIMNIQIKTSFTSGRFFVPSKPKAAGFRLKTVK